MPALGLGTDQVGEVVAYLDSTSDVAPAVPILAGPRELSDGEFDEASSVYFNRCAGCHGTLRAGATGPNIQPERTLEIGTTGLTTILTNGLPGGMPAWGEAGILTADEIELMANFVQLDPPTPPPLDLAEITESWNLVVPVADRPTEPRDRPRLGELHRSHPARRRAGRDHGQRHTRTGCDHRHRLRRAHPARRRQRVGISSRLVATAVSR